jgi:hypothetical protein
VVEDLSYQFSDNQPAHWTPEIVEQAREHFLEQLLRERDAFIYSNEDILLDALQHDGTLKIIDDSEIAAATTA